MAISVVQTATGTGNPPCIFSSNITLGNAVILVAPCYNTSGSSNNITAVKIGTNTISGTFACFNNGGTGGINSASSGGNVAYISIWVIPNIQVSGQTNVDYTASASQVGQVAYEVSGLGTSPTLDQSASGSGIVTGTVTSGATGAITGAPEFIIGGAMIFAGATGAPSGFTTQNPTNDCWAGYQIATSSGGTYTWTQTGSGEPFAVALATILGTPAAPVPSQVVLSAPYRPPPPPLRAPVQLITGPLPAVPAMLAGIVQPEGLPFQAPQQVTPQAITGFVAPVVTAAAGLATGTGAALGDDTGGALPAVGADAGLATGTGAALGSGVSLVSAPMLAQAPYRPPPAPGRVAPQVITGPPPAVPGTANAQLATGTGAALAPTAAIVADGALATGTGAALGPTGSAGAAAGLPAGTGAALAPVPAIVVTAGLATGTGAALAPGQGATAGLATGTGAASLPSLAIAADAAAATALGAALNATGAAVLPFTVGQLTASTAAAGATAGTLTASTAPGSTLTASTEP